MSKNFYEILNIEIGASPDEIKKAYRNMANKFHPDKIKNEEQKEKANKIFLKINEAYKILSDEKARKEYDKKLKQEKPNDENGFFNVFSRKKKEHLKATLEVVLEELHKGEHKIIGEHKFKLKAGQHEDGNILILTNKKGEKLEVLLRIKKHPIFKIAGNDLIQKVPVSLKTAVLGGPVEVYTLDGPKKVKIGAGASHGERYKLDNQGWYSQKGKRGNMLVDIEIEMPKRLKANQLELFEKFCESLGNEEGTLEKKYKEKWRKN